MVNVGAHDDCELRRLALGVDDDADHAQGYMRAGSVFVSGTGDEGHLRVVVDVDVVRHFLVGQFLDLAEKAEAVVLGRQFGKEIPAWAC